MHYIQIWYIQFHVKIWRFHINRTRGDDCTFSFQVVSIIPTDGHRRLDLFFSGHNYVKIGFGGNVMTGKKTYSRLAGYVFQRVQITTRKNYDRKKNVQSGQLCFSAGSNYNRKKLRPKKKPTVVQPSVENWKKLHAEKRYSRL